MLYAGGDMRFRNTLFGFAAAAFALAATEALAAGKITIVTPYMAQPGTQY